MITTEDKLRFAEVQKHDHDKDDNYPLCLAMLAIEYFSPEKVAARLANINGGESL